ncbi:MAG: ABC transporter permease [Blastocatellia bacterium AA13]|nr:MAG: ABC transporter permease [Blastocatellia bacterium AA13]
MAEAGGEFATTAAAARERGARQTRPEGRLSPLVQLTLCRTREFLREPEAVFWVFIFPMLLACALGIAFRNTAPDKARVAIETSESAAGSQRQGNTLGADETARALNQSSSVAAEVMTSEKAAQALRTGRVDLVVRQSAGGFEYRFDPTRPESRMARLTADDSIQRAMGRTDSVAIKDERVTEPGARYIDFLIPGLIGMNLMGSGMWGLGFAVVQARNRKLLKRLAATPMRRSHYLLSFMFSRLLFLVFEVVAVVVFAWLVFGVAVRGSVINLAIIALIGAMAFAGLGLLVASRPKTIEGVSGLMNLVMLPMWLLSGTFFSSARFPAFLQPLIRALPLTALNDSLRAVINEGAPLSVSATALIILIAWSGVSFMVALRLFRWQ